MLNKIKKITLTEIFLSLWGLLNFFTRFFTIFLVSRGTAMISTEEAIINVMIVSSRNKTKNGIIDIVRTKMNGVLKMAAR